MPLLRKKMKNKTENNAGECNLPRLEAEAKIKIRFSEVDSMGIAWHGSYPLYFEDAREAFGDKYGLSYKLIYESGYFAPLVELNFKYRKPLRHGQEAVVRIIYRPTPAAKILFDYEITDASGEIYATGSSMQVFMDSQYNLVWDNPGFYARWKRENGVDI